MAATEPDRASPIDGICGPQFGDVSSCTRTWTSTSAGEILSLVGGSGSGKTTLLRQMLGLEQPGARQRAGVRRGHHGADSGTLQALRNRWGMLFQHGALFSALTVFDNVA